MSSGLRATQRAPLTSWSTEVISRVPLSCKVISYWRGIATQTFFSTIETPTAFALGSGERHVTLP